jgi:serine/tyrosine/threonine adenylyltransferase
MEKRKVILETGWKLDNSYAKLPKSFYTIQKSTPVRSPQLIILNHSLATSLGLNIKEMENNDGVAVLAGNQIPEGSVPLAQAYAGHQFGHFTMLGDGRALLIGEQITPQGERVDIQLKGSGRTPYSRGGDGRAAVGPMLREYIISEAMYSLGIPTTRSLAVVSTGESIIRETILPGAILTRVAASHVRVATFQYAAERGTVEDIKFLADYTLNRHFSEGKGAENPYLFLLEEVIKRQAELIAKWQLVGFIHGVMNTDNMSISGETIDYGPCAFLDTYDPETVFSSIDREGRYAYGNQPYIAGWNLARFAETLLPLLHDNQEESVKLAQDAVSRFSELYHKNWMAGMRSKLGIFNEEQEDESLFKGLLSIMQKYSADYTNTFLALTFDKISDMDMFDSESFKEWYKLWQERIARQEETKDASHELMKNYNPAIIPRNHRVEEALKAAEKKEDYSIMERLLKVLSNPYEHSIEQTEYSTVPAQCSQPYRTFCGT